MYSSPRFTVHGSIEELTLQGSGEDPCRFNEPRDEFKQTGPADLIQGQANLTTCTPASP